jgi:hypothetical protein
MRPLSTVYRGSRTDPESGTVSDVVVTRDGEPLTPRASLRLRNHSPTGFAWGYGDSGPHQLALAILLDFYGDKELALELYHSFCTSRVAGWGDEWTITGDRIEAWREATHSERNG